MNKAAVNILLHFFFVDINFQLLWVNTKKTTDGLYDMSVQFYKKLSIYIPK